MKNAENTVNFTTNLDTPYQELLKDANFFARVEEILSQN